MFDIQRILVATDFGKSSVLAVATAAHLACKHGAILVVFHCYEVPLTGFEGVYPGGIDFITPIREDAEKQLAAIVASLRGTLPSVTSQLSFGVPWQSLLDVAAAARADLIVMGTHGRRGIAHALLGSVAEKIVQLSPVAVLTVPMARDAVRRPITDSPEPSLTTR